MWRTCHGPVLGDPMSILLNDTARFLSEQPGEVLVLEFSHTAGNPSAANVSAFLDLIQSSIGQWMMPRTVQAFPTVGAMVSANQRVLATYEDDGAISDRPSFWSGNTIINSYADSPVLATMEQYNVGKATEFANHQKLYPGQLFKMSWTLTPNGDTVAEMVLPGKPKTLLELADIADADLSAWFARVRPQLGLYPYLGNILIIDHESISPILDIVTAGLLNEG
jgi:hypothetical protein